MKQNSISTEDYSFLGILLGNIYFLIHLVYFKANPILHAMRVPLAHRCMLINQDKAEISDTHLLSQFPLICEDCQ